MKSSTNTTNNAGSAAIALVKQCIKALKEGIRHPIMCYSHKVGRNIGTIKFVLKVKDNKDERIKLMRVVSSEKNMSKVTTRFCKIQDRSEIKTVFKSRLIHINRKTLHLINGFTDKSKTTHVLIKHEMRRLAKDL